LLESEVAIRTLELREARDTALSASRQKSEFLSILTHEIRTPLTSIKGHTELAIRDLRFIEDANDIIERLAIVLGTGREMLEIIDHILEYARVEAGKTELKCKQIYLPAFVHTMATSIQPMVLRNRNELHVHLEGKSVAELDEGKLIVIMHNLLTNACKYTVDGQIQLQVACRAHKLSIVVADTGIGIPEDQQKAIFEPFNQVDKSNRRTYSGVGLGLAISKRYCEMRGGSMTLRSRIGCGSMFSVDIPLPIARGPPVPPT
jgi:two-component system sensor histidine kinase BarA